MSLPIAYKYKTMIVHLCDQEKFMPAFVDLIENAQLDLIQRYFVARGRDRYAFTPRENVVIVGSFADIQNMLESMQAASKIILHGLYFDVASKLLLEHPLLLKKCYWSMWGNDFYFPERQPQWRHLLIKKIPFYLTRNRGDFELARVWYGGDAELLECTGYTSNACEIASPILRTQDTINLLVGNSADPDNHHLEVLEFLAKVDDIDFHVYAPLSYGSDDHARIVADAGARLLGARFTPLLDYLDLDSYYDFLAKIDIALFNHHKQQAMGNIINLLGLGKKVYMRSDLSSWHSFIQDSLVVYDITKDVNFDRLNSSIAQRNHKIVKKSYSRERVLNDWMAILNHNSELKVA